MSELALPSYWKLAQAQLMKSDRILRKIIPLHGDQGLTVTESPFVTLIRAIMAQQASRQTALTQWRCFVAHYGDQPDPAKIAILSATSLRQIGLPKRKAEYIIEVSTHFVNGHINMAHLASLDNENVIQTLCEIRGVGRWTAEMFLIFNLRRADVLPLDDAALLKAISKHYFSGEPVSRFEAREVAQAWAPWCTVATWHLWRSLNAVAVHY